MPRHDAYVTPISFLLTLLLLCALIFADAHAAAATDITLIATPLMRCRQLYFAYFLCHLRRLRFMPLLFSRRCCHAAAADMSTTADSDVCCYRCCRYRALFYHMLRRIAMHDAYLSFYARCLMPLTALLRRLMLIRRCAGC